LSAETFKEGWDGVVGNVQRKIGRVVGNVQRRLGRVLRRGRRKCSIKAGMGPPYGLLETSKKGWNGSSSGERVFRNNVQRKIGRVVKNVQRRLGRVIKTVVGNVQ
jgi:hypothetical protein